MRENLSHDLVPPPKDKGILVYANDRGVTIHIPCGLFRFRLLLPFLLRRRERKEPWGARFSEVPVTFGARDQIVKSKYKE